MQIVTGYENLLRDIDVLKKSDKVKITVLYHDEDTMTVQEHIDLESLRIKPEFRKSEFPNTEIGWSMLAGSLLAEFSECVIVTDIEGLLLQKSISTKSGTRTVYFVKTMPEALKIGSGKKPAKRARKSSGMKEAEESIKKEEPVLKENDREPSSPEQLPMPEPAETPIQEDIRNITNEQDIPSGKDDPVIPTVSNTDFLKKKQQFEDRIVSLGIDQDDAEKIRTSILDAQDSLDLQNLLRGRVRNPELDASILKGSFGEIKAMAVEVEKLSI